MFEVPTPVYEPQVLVKRYAVFGQPIGHSRSPFIHQRFSEQAKIPLSYFAIEASPEAFPAALEAFAAGGGRGANVTLPLKGLAAGYCEVLGPHARRSGVVNTLSRTESGWRGDNTDGLGLVADLAERHRVDLRGRRTLILGAGGAVAAVLPALLDAGIATATIANRSPERADGLADRFNEPARVHTVYWDGLADAGSFDFIVNGTSAGQFGERLSLPFSCVAPRALCYDLSYGRAAVDFLARARAAGCEHAYDGSGMLVEQAAEAFQIWHGVRPDTEPVYQALRQELGGR